MTKKVMGRKGQAEFVVYLIRAAVAAILLVLVAIEIGFFTNMQLQTSGLEAHLIMQRLLDGPNGLELRDEKTGQLLPGTVDLSKFANKLALTTMYNEGFDGDNFWGGQVTLYLSREEMANNTPVISKLSFDTPATNLLPLVKAGARGKGGGLYYGATYPVRYRLQPDAPFQTGWLTIELVKRT